MSAQLSAGGRPVLDAEQRRVLRELVSAEQRRRWLREVRLNGRADKRRARLEL